jgi:uncharacterized protein YbjT (DUF2867 family)
MHLILTGATGLIGTACLDRMLALTPSTISKLSILTRKPVALAEGNPHVNVIIHKDYEHYPKDVLEKLEGAEGCVWALGPSVTAVSKT